MRYMILISGDEKSEPQASSADRDQVFAAYMKYTQDLQKAGVYLAGDALMPTATGARVAVRDGKRTIVDGPFAEAKEVIGGYYLIQVKSKEEAVEWASRCPGAHHGTVEVRHVLDLPA
jgi:hypothetical protein